MGSPLVIEGVSKRFRLQSEKVGSIKEAITQRLRPDHEEFWALRDVNLEIPAGSMFALIGHNGSGKSTLLRCVAGIYRPTTGRIQAEGRISALLELGAGFHPDLTGRENIQLNAAILGLHSDEIEGSFDAIVDFAGVRDFIDVPIKHYSSGMNVRLGFAVAVHLRPEILIIDEVIAVGDEEFQRRCFDFLYELRRKGVTIVVVSHSLELIRSLCDEAAWLEHGRVMASGPVNQVVKAYVSRERPGVDPGGRRAGPRGRAGADRLGRGAHRPRRAAGCARRLVVAGSARRSHDHPAALRGDRAGAGPPVRTHALPRERHVRDRHLDAPGGTAHGPGAGPGPRRLRALLDGAHPRSLPAGRRHPGPPCPAPLRPGRADGKLRGEARLGQRGAGLVDLQGTWSISADENRTEDR